MLRRKVVVGALVSVALCATASVVHGALVLSGGGLALMQQGGSISAGNLSGAATVFATPSYAAPPTHQISNLNDGVFGNSSSWLAQGTNVHGVAFAGMSFGTTATNVSSFAFGRSNTLSHTDRTLGLYTLQYTQVANPHTNLDLASNANPTLGWSTIGTLDYQSAGGPNFSTPSLRHLYNFNTVSATGLRLIVPNSNGAAGGTAVDELEFYSTQFVPPTLAVGSSVIQDETSNSAGLGFGGLGIAEPAPGNGSYLHANGPGTYTWTPGFYGEDVIVETSWGVSLNHSKDVDFFFDPDGPGGPLTEIALLQNVDQTLMADQTTTPAGVVWSDFLTIASGLDINPLSTFRVTGTSAGGVPPEALNSAAWRFTSTPEPASILAWVAALAVAGSAMVVYRRKQLRRK